MLVLPFLKPGKATDNKVTFCFELAIVSTLTKYSFYALIGDYEVIQHSFQKN